MSYNLERTYQRQLCSESPPFSRFLFAIFLITKGALVTRPNSTEKMSVPSGVGEEFVTYGTENKSDSRLGEFEPVIVCCEDEEEVVLELVVKVSEESAVELVDDTETV